MDKKLFWKFNVIDLIIVAVLVAAVAGVVFVKMKNRIISPEALKETKKVEIDIVLQDEKFSGHRDLFKPGEKTFITIRNVPYVQLEILKVSVVSDKTPIPNPKKPDKAIAVNDPTKPYTYDFLITVSDKAIITPDGVVVGGNKIKIGLPITLEGFDYRLSGLVSDVRVME